MTKYIVKNCPAYGVTTPTSCALTSDDSCEFTDCPIKQVVELCKKEIGKEVHRWGDVVLNKNNPLAEKTLQTLDVQEVE